MKKFILVLSVLVVQNAAAVPLSVMTEESGVVQIDIQPGDITTNLDFFNSVMNELVANGFIDDATDIPLYAQLIEAIAEDVDGAIVASEESRIVIPRDEALFNNLARHILNTGHGFVLEYE